MHERFPAAAGGVIPDPLSAALAGFAPDPAVTRVLVTAGDGAAEVQAEIVRAGRRARHPIPSVSADDLRGFVATLLGPGRSSGAVAVQGMSGFAALPPAAASPVLLLHRRAAPHGSPDMVVADGLLTRELHRAVVALLEGGGGVLLAGPPRSRLHDVLGAVADGLSPAIPVAVVEPSPRITLSRDAVRLRDLPPDPRRGLGDAVLVIDLPEPPPLASLAPPVAVAVTARSPGAALARLKQPGAALSHADAAAWAETAPFLLSYGRSPLGPRIEAAWEIQPRLDPDTGLPDLVLLMGMDPSSGALVETGAIPSDPALREALREARRKMAPSKGAAP